MSTTPGPSSTEQQAIQAVMQALNTLYTNPSNQAKASANEWLQNFQQTSEAWQTANSLLLASELPLEPRLFAAQTFRTKITFDLEQVPSQQRVALRDTLLNALSAYASGPRVIQTQLSLALSGLAIQLDESDWPTVIPGMIERLGSSPETVPVLLEFLTVLPEEVITNHRIPIDNDFYNARCHFLLSAAAPEILKLLAMYVQASGLTSQIQAGIFQCLRSWLKSGEVSASQMADTPLFDLSFDALASDELFDVATDVVCDLISETQEVEENMDVIQRVLARLQPLRQELSVAGDDEDKVRGLCRIFVQAGEAYHRIILRHSNELYPVAEAIAECTAYHDLDIVQITFRFWYLLSGALSHACDHPEAYRFYPLYERLLEIIIRHLRFPDDPDALTGQERDDFRSFRHFMGDTLKDCCHVLGSRQCLSRSLHLIQTTISQSTPETLKWQDVEAPLFSMRAMGAEADPRDDEVLPQIINIIPTLPDHPKLKYAGLLVLSRYTEWIDLHPEQIPAQLSYISAGLERADPDVTAAAAQAMNFLCQDCHRHLVPFLSQLYDFFRSVNDKLGPDDLISISEGIAYVIAGMQSDEAPQALMQFAQPLLESLSQVATLPNASKDQLRRSADRMEQLEKMLAVIGTSLSDHLPEACSKTCEEAYSVIDRVLASHGNVFFISERSSALLRRGLALFSSLAASILVPLLERLASCFEQTGFSGYVWIVGKCIDQFGRDGNMAVRAALQGASERVNGKMVQLLEDTMPAELGDVLDDYVHTCLAELNNVPSILFLSPQFPQVFRAALVALTLLKTETVGTALDLVLGIVGHDALMLPVTASQPGTPMPAAGTPNADGSPSMEDLASYAAAIRHAVGQQGFQLASVLLNGLVTQFSPEVMPVVVTTLKVLSGAFIGEMILWVPGIVEQLPTSYVPDKDKNAFVERYLQAAHGKSFDQIKQALNGLYTASRKARERSRLDKGPGALLER
ncbi:related to MTR10 - involved in nuclear protein import [Melanopsichium pennsylvanicum]|uniref:Related to MTR10 - involved in nuclear protein import n=2 Tax=Melanopsichium pennsylvanicum TaxID=63383 RepID=A0AAJ5C484_9BASI|nr:related to MTR10-involved in nuclear protein import [Melanopsichium pennsylvanicum 4]SNX83219.1 related to MTR10 - involved in nuclear protein import [Melanopsichium pennsylvanicum]